MGKKKKKKKLMCSECPSYVPMIENGKRSDGMCGKTLRATIKYRECIVEELRKLGYES